MDDHALLALAARLAEQAGAAILAVRARGFAVERKHDLSPVTEADRAAEAIIVAGLRDATPDFPVIAEEEVAAGRITAPAPAFWLVDPLDGTREFAGGKDEFVVNIGLVRDGRMALGVVAIPALGELFTGIVGAGAWKRDRSGEAAIHTRAPPEDGLTVVASRLHGDTARLDDIPGRAACGAHAELRLGAEILPPGGGRRRPLPALRPHHGMGHRRAAGGAGGRRRPRRHARWRRRCATASPAGRTRTSSAGGARFPHRPVPRRAVSLWRNTIDSDIELIRKTRLAHWPLSCEAPAVAAYFRRPCREAARMILPRRHFVAGALAAAALIRAAPAMSQSMLVELDPSQSAAAPPPLTTAMPPPTQALAAAASPPARCRRGGATPWSRRRWMDAPRSPW